MNASYVALAAAPLSIENARHMMDDILEVFFADRIAKAAAIDEAYATLWRNTARLSAIGGKRIRPYVMLLTHQAWTDQPAASVAHVAAALELLHLAMLVHDDIIDRDLIRYGVDNVAGQQDKLYTPYLSDPIERRHFSDSAAILAGDVLISEGYQLLLKAAIPAAKKLLATKLYGQAIFTVAGGELLDTESAFRPFDSVSALTIALHKTAHYSFVTPLVMGATLGGASDDDIASLTRFGETVGVAYQLVDDILGVFGDSAATGKSNDSDLKEAKHTYMVEQFRRHASASQLAAFNTLFGKSNLSPGEADHLRALLIESGAKKLTESAIETYITTSLDIIDSMAISSDTKRIFTDLVARVTKRLT